MDTWSPPSCVYQSILNPRIADTSTVTIGGAAAFLFFGLLYLFECYVEV